MPNGQDGIFSGGKQLLDLFAQTVQPRPSIFIGQRMTIAHLFDVCCRMKIVGFNKTPAEFARQQLAAHRCFSDARNSENDYDHGTSRTTRPTQLARCCIGEGGSAFPQFMAEAGESGAAWASGLAWRRLRAISPASVQSVDAIRVPPQTIISLPVQTAA